MAPRGRDRTQSWCGPAAGARQVGTAWRGPPSRGRRVLAVARRTWAVMTMRSFSLSGAAGTRRAARPGSGTWDSRSSGSACSRGPAVW